jgi:type II secretory pathway pseudopilin PulG
MLGIMAAVVVPSFSSPDPERLDTAAQEFADAMRFARSEAMRLGEPRGFTQNSSDKRIRLFRPDTGTSPWSLVYDVYHPVSKQIYDITLDTHAFAKADSVVATRVYRGACNQQWKVYFDAGGIPRCTDPASVLLQQYDVTLSLGTQTRVVSLDGITGQVSVQ